MCLVSRESTERALRRDVGLCGEEGLVIVRVEEYGWYVGFFELQH